MNYSKSLPSEVRKLIREGKLSGQTSGMCDGYAQANLIILPRDLAYDFLHEFYEVPDFLENYIDYERYGNELKYDGFHEYSEGIIEIR